MTKKDILVDIATRWADALVVLPPAPNDKTRELRLLDWTMREHVGIWMRAAGLGDTWARHILPMATIVDESSLARVIGPPYKKEEWPVLGECNFPFDYALRAAMAAYEKSDARERLIQRRPSAASYPVAVAALSGLDEPCAVLWTVLACHTHTAEDDPYDEIARASSHASILFKICTNLLDDETRVRTTREAYASVGVFLGSLVR